MCLRVVYRIYFRPLVEVVPIARRKEGTTNALTIGDSASRSKDGRTIICFVLRFHRFLVMDRECLRLVVRCMREHFEIVKDSTTRVSIVAENALALEQLEGVIVVGV